MENGCGGSWSLYLLGCYMGREMLTEPVRVTVSGGKIPESSNYLCFLTEAVACKHRPPAGASWLAMYDVRH